MKIKIVFLLMLSTVLSFSQSYNINELALDTVAVNVSPNPFFTTCEIDFELEEQDTVSLNVYTVTGQVDSLYFEDSLLNAGLYSFEYSTENDGLYFVALTINGENFSKKIMKTNSPTSILIKDEIETISISPNPAKQFVKIEFLDETVRNIKILNVSGKLVKQIQKYKEKSLILKIEGYAKGIYYISINNGNMQTTKTLIVD